MSQGQQIYSFSHKLLLLFVTFSLVLSLIPSHTAFAEGNMLYITLSGSSQNNSQMNIGTTFTVNVRSYAETDKATGTVGGFVTYPSNLLQVISTSTSGSLYGSPSIAPGNGAISFNGSRAPAPSGTAQIFSITFKAVGAGTAVVSFGASSYVNNETTSHNSGTYTIKNPNSATSPPNTPRPATPAPKPAPVTSSATTPQPQPVPVENPQPTPDPTGLIDTVIVNALYNSSTISWRVNANNATTSLTYGSSNTQLDKSATIKKEANGTFSTSITGLVPGQRYYFNISASGGNVNNTTYNGVIIARGYPVTFNVTENGVAVQGGQIKIGNQTFLIGSSGKVTIGLASGNYTGTITTNTASLSINLTVEPKPIPTDGNAPEAQSFPFDLKSSPLEQGPGSSVSVLGFIGILLAGTAVLVIGVIGFIVYRRRSFEGGDDLTYQNVSPTVIVDDGYDWQPPDGGTTEGIPGSPKTASPYPSINLPPNLPRHHNSVYLSEDEPPDMFEQVKQSPQLSSAEHPISTGEPVVTGHTSSSPRSTMP